MNDMNGWVPIIILIFEMALIPFAWKILEALTKISDTTKRFSDSISNFCASLTKISEEMVEARIRDKDIQADLDKIKHELRLHTEEERRKG